MGKSYNYRYAGPVAELNFISENANITVGFYNSKLWQILDQIGTILKTERRRYYQLP